MKLRYVVVEIEGPQGIGAKRVPMCFSHGFPDELIKTAVLAVVSEDKVVSEGQAYFVKDNIVAVDKFQPELFGKLCLGRHDEILLESAEHL